MRLPLSVLLLSCAAVLIALPFLFDGLHGVHRWLVIGGIRLHPASFAIPLFLIVFRSAEREAGSRLVWTLAFALSALLIAQPDAAEATGFILAALLLIIKRARTHVTKWLVTLLGSALLICAWLRPDPLGAVPHVEGIIGLATTQSPLLGFLAIASLALALSPFLRTSTHDLDPNHRATTLALGLYFIGKLLATLTGSFPVPLLGYSASEIIGYFLALTISAPRFKT